MTVNDLYMTISHLYYYSDVTAYDKHNKILPDVAVWGDLVGRYPESEVLFFNYELGEITLDKIRRK